MLMSCDRVAPELPTSFGNGLSYYEEMQILTEKLNEVIEEVNTFDEDFTEVNEKMVVINNDLAELESNVTNLDTELTQHEIRIEALENGVLNVTMVDNTSGGVDLTVDDTTRTLARQEALAVFDTRISTNSSAISQLENTVILQGGDIADIKEELLGVDSILGSGVFE